LGTRKENRAPSAARQLPSLTPLAPQPTTNSNNKQQHRDPTAAAVEAGVEEEEPVVDDFEPVERLQEQGIAAGAFLVFVFPSSWGSVFCFFDGRAL